GWREGGVTVVTVSGGRTGTKLGRGDALRLGGITTVADVDALSPPLTITTVAMTASTKTIPAIVAIGRHR
ncbi:MAG TPA: serine kinase, partial [Mycobacterium sp.]|nr:serine kinase [Mycobacterium sp.]